MLEKIKIVELVSINPLIKGVNYLSTIDYPGQLSAILFFGKCSWKCPHCYNLEALKKAPLLEWSKIKVEFLKRIKFLDAVTLSGGEPTEDFAVESVLHWLKQVGFKVALHTNGSHPKELKKWVSEGLLDFIGLDVKTIPSSYAEMFGVAADVFSDKVVESLEVVISFGKGEVRTTLLKDILSPSVLFDLAVFLKKKGVKRWVIQNPVGYVGYNVEELFPLKSLFDSVVLRGFKGLLYEVYL